MRPTEASSSKSKVCTILSHATVRLESMLPSGMAGTAAMVKVRKIIHLQRVFAIFIPATQVNTVHYARGRQNNDAQTRIHDKFSLGFS